MLALSVADEPEVPVVPVVGVVALVAITIAALKTANSFKGRCMRNEKYLRSTSAIRRRGSIVSDGEDTTLGQNRIIIFSALNEVNTVIIIRRPSITWGINRGASESTVDLCEQ